MVEGMHPCALAHLLGFGGGETEAAAEYILHRRWDIRKDTKAMHAPDDLLVRQYRSASRPVRPHYLSIGGQLFF